MSGYIRVWTLAFFCAALLALHVSFAPEFGATFVLKTKAELAVYDDPNPPVSAQPVANVSAGETLEVVGCQDIKSYIVPMVKLAGGKIGYVVDGEFEIVKLGYSYLRIPSLALSACHPFLRER